ncbi:hypothetical protein PI172_0075 [Prevotella intermedia]|uniref:Uncharacterized protein n=1 Tax=Prevotella intermedia TaxID=28131 RepID=A0AAD1F657_PREIN|nr:hypothetical protein PI172_0075 [Prevotella intermedia]
MQGKLYFLATHLYLYYLVGKDTFLSYLTSEAYNLYIYKWGTKVLKLSVLTK